MAYGAKSYSAVPYGVAPLGSAPAVGASLERYLILSPRESDAATMVASSEVASLPVTNLQTMQPSQVWRATSASVQSIDITFAYPVAANAVALVAHNLSAAGVIRVRGGRTQARAQHETSNDVDTGYVSAWPATGKPTSADWPAHIALATFENDELYQYWRVDIADGGTTLSCIEAGRLVLGRAFQPSINFDYGGQPISFEPADLQLRTSYGRTFTDRRATSPPRLFELSVYAMTKREAFDGLFEVQRTRGMWGDVICALDPGESTDFHRFTVQGVFGNGGAYTLPPAFDGGGQMFGAGIRLREVI